MKNSELPAGEAEARIAKMLANGTPKADVVEHLVSSGVSEHDAIDLADRVEYVLQTGFRPTSPRISWMERIPGGLGSLVVTVAVLGLVGYNNIVAFNAGRDGCRWGKPTETQCGLQSIGAAKGRILAPVMSGPGFLLGKALAPEDKAAD